MEIWAQLVTILTITLLLLLHLKTNFLIPSLFKLSVQMLLMIYLNN